MSVRGGLLGMVPGRVTVRVPVPADLLDEANRLADQSGMDRAVVLGDLVAEVLPDALADAARDILAPHLPPHAATPPVLTDGATSESLTTSPTAIVARPATEPEPSRDATAG